ncbi:hepatitis A virus cellular receptor 1 homolog isoform X2 [Myripristis murdjan]|uniref:hepatitis A virus cellular receptor 1 homolog isoform X2 n=1 Tax=Myripristis murdjan TaxID=586833 RepID=UPI001176143E|nr:hepatitis A virus cellular receptor 1 homolog isoform X2 [Myripristis murdjan]
MAGISWYLKWMISQSAGSSSVTWSAGRACVFADMETVVGVSGRKVMLPCHSWAVSQGKVEICWGRGEPSLFTCHNTLIATDGAQVKFRTSHRYMLSPRASSDDASLSIYKSRASDSGFYHCRIQLPGLFNDQTFTVHLIIINGPTDPLPPVKSLPSIHSPLETQVEPKTPRTPPSHTGADVTVVRRSDVTAVYTTGLMVVQVKIPKLPVQQEQLHELSSFIGNTVRLALIIFIPALLLAAAYRVWSCKKKASCKLAVRRDVQEPL